MKQKIERTNTSTKRFSVRTIAMVLSIVMLIGSIATGSMLSTFAAYLKDAAKSDALSQAATEGGAIAQNSIPSEDAAEADTAEETPDLSGFEENEIVRGMKDDLAGTGASVDLAGTGYDVYDENLYYLNSQNWGTVQFAAWDTGSGYWSADLVHCDSTNASKLYVLDYNNNVSGIDRFVIRNKNNTSQGTALKYTGVTSRSYMIGTDSTIYSLSTINSRAKVIAMVADDGSTYTQQTSANVATVSGYYKENNGNWNVKSDSGSTSASSSSAEISTIYSSTITYTASAAAGYTFKGFATSKSSSLPGTLYTSGTTQTASNHNGNSETTYYAYFARSKKSVTVNRKLGTASASGDTTVSVNVTAATNGTKIDMPTTVTSGGNTYIFDHYLVTGAAIKASNSLSSGYSDVAVNGTYAGFTSGSNTSMYVKTDNDNVVITAVYKQKLATPTISLSPNPSNEGNVTLTVGNYDSATVASYTLYINGLVTETTFTGDTYTIAATSSDNNKAYSVVANPKDATNYVASDVSEQSTLAVYAPLYSLGGDVDSTYLSGTYTYTTPGSATAASAPYGNTSKWNQYQAGLAIDDSTGTPGVYSITFTTKTEAELKASNHSNYIDVSLVTITNNQSAFNLNGTDYNSNGKDYPVPDAGVAWADNLYLKSISTTSPGGSLRLQPDTTYTITIDQRTGLSGESTHIGKLKIETDKINVTTVARVERYDATARAYQAISDAPAAIGVASADPARGAKNGFTTALTASVKNSSYEFVGWYSDADCATTALSTDATYSGVEIAPNTYPTYYALFREKLPTPYTITPSGEHGSVSTAAGSYTGAEVSGGNFTAYKGATVTLTAVPAAGYMLSDISAGNCTASYSGNTITLANVTGNVALALTFTQIPTYTVHVSADSTTYCNTLQAVSYTDGNGVAQTNLNLTKSGYDLVVRQGTVVELTTTATSGGTFDGWTVVDGTYLRDSSTPFTASTIKVKPTSDMTLKANFAQKSTGTTSAYSLNLWPETSGQGIYNSNLGLTEYSSFTYDSKTDLHIAVVTITNDSSSNNFIQVKKTVNSSVYWYYHEGNGGNASSNWISFKKNGSVDGQNGKFNATKGKTYTIMLHEIDNDNVEIRVVEGDLTPSGGGDATDDTNPSTDDYTKLYALDGINNDNGTSRFGETKITNSKHGMLSLPYYDVTNGDQLVHENYDYSRVYYYKPDQDLEFHIETTINSGYQAMGVRAFVMNGMTFKAKKNATTGKYYADILLPGGSGEGVLEVIPVYYNIYIPDDDYIQFYVDSTSIPTTGTASWGKNIGYSVWYGNTALHAETGGYPGQPLMSDGNLLYGYIPRYYYSVNASSAPAAGYSKTGDNAFAGVLLTNLAENNSGTGYHQEVLTAWGAGTGNYQSFDYEDPVKIKELDDNDENIDIDMIKFETKYNTNYTDSRFKMYDKPMDITTDSGTASKVAWRTDIEEPTGESDYFELLKNIDGKPVNIFNDPNQTFVDNNNLYVVSVGNQVSTESGNFWDTTWVVYDKDYKFVAVAHPYEFIDPSSALETTFANYLTSKVYILYEKWTPGTENPYKDSGTNTGTRLDGRWLYSSSTDDTTARLRVATKDPSGKLTFFDKTTGLQWSDIYSSDKESTVESDNKTKLLSLDNRTTTVTAKINPVGYKIEGMYMQKSSYSISSSEDNGYSGNISDYDNLNVGAATMTEFVNSRDNRMVIVLEQIPATDLVITHQMYGGDDAHRIPGFYYLKAELYNSEGTLTETYGGTAADGYKNVAKSPIEIKKFTTAAPKGEGYTLKVYIKTAMSGDSTFYQWFENDHHDGYNKLNSETARGSNDPVVYVREINVDEELYYTDSSSDQLKIVNLDYYSDIIAAGQVNIHHELLPDVDAAAGVTWNDVAVVSRKSADAPPIVDYYNRNNMTTVTEDYISESNIDNYLRVQIWTIPSAHYKFNAFYKNVSTLMATETDANGFEYVTNQRTKEIDGKRYELAYVYIPIRYFFKTVKDDNNEDVHVFDSTKKDVYLYSDLERISGELQITHNLSSNATPSSADVYVAAKVLDVNGDEISGSAIAETDGATGITVSSDYIKAGSSNSLQITLRTQLHEWIEFTEFRAFVDTVAGKLTNGQTTSDNATIAIDTSTKNCTAVITFPISNIFDNNDVQRYATLPFYSVTVMPDYKYSIRYKYNAYNPNYGVQSYTVEDSFTTDELNTFMEFNNSNELAFKTNEGRVTFLSNHAPYEDNYMQTISYASFSSLKRTWVASSHTLSFVVEPGSYTNETVTATFNFPYDVNVGTGTADTEYTPKTAIGDTSKVPGSNTTKQSVTVNNVAVNGWVTTNGVTSKESAASLGKDPIFVKAPLMIYVGSGLQYFRYWTVKTEATAKNTNNSQVEYTKCYNPEFNLAVFENCIITPVYTTTSYQEMGMTGPPSSWDEYTRFDREFMKARDIGTITEGSNDITITFIENSRNQYNMGNYGATSTIIDPRTGVETDTMTTDPTMTASRQGAGDRVYSDFLLSFNNAADGKIICDEYKEGEKKAGMIIESVADLAYNSETKKYYVESEETYKSAYGATLSHIKTGASKEELQTYITSGTRPTGCDKAEFDATELDNKNRIQYYYSLANRAHKSASDDIKTMAEGVYGKNNHRVFRAYAYIADYSKGTYSNVKISETPVYFTILETGSIMIPAYVPKP